MSRHPLLAALIAAPIFIGPAHALEAFRGYDNFSAGPIDPARWTDGDRSRSLRGGQLVLAQRTWGSNSADSGSSFVNFTESFVNPSLVTAMRAKVTVNTLEVNACPANTALGQSRARLVGGFFNAGVPVPGSQVGDAIARVRLTRFSNSEDAPGVLRVQGILSLCTSADCLGNILVGNIVDLGTVTLGQATTVQLQWDQPAKTFLFSRDNGAFSGSVACTESDANPPGVPFKSLSTRLDLPSCATSPRVIGVVDASFDNIAVNRSAVT